MTLCPKYLEEFQRLSQTCAPPTRSSAPHRLPWSLLKCQPKPSGGRNQAEGCRRMGRHDHSPHGLKGSHSYTLLESQQFSLVVVALVGIQTFTQEAGLKPILSFKFFFSAYSFAPGPMVRAPHTWIPLPCG